MLVNAAGPYVTRVLRDVVGDTGAAPRPAGEGQPHRGAAAVYAHDRSYIFQNADGRVCFAIPYEQDFTLIGTTDEDFHGDPAEVASTPRRSAICAARSASTCAQPVDPADIVWRYAGVRPLLDDGASKAQEATRDYVLELDDASAVLSVFGGKITTYRRLAEAAMAKLAPLFPGMRGAWTAGAALPGGDFPWDGVDQAARRSGTALSVPGRSDASPPGARLRHAGGRDAGRRTRRSPTWGAVFGADLTEREVDWLVRTEWARTAEDVLWRRSKLGLRLGPAEVATLGEYLCRIPAT